MWTDVHQALNQSAASVVTGIVRLVPGTIALVVSVLLAALAGSVLRLGLRRILNGLEFDRRMATWGWTDVTGHTSVSPTALVATVAWWGMLCLGFVVGVAAFDPTLTSQLALRLFGSAMNLITALVLLLAGTVLARTLSRGVLISLVNMNVAEARLISLGVKWLVMVLAAAMALDHLNVGGRIVDLAFGILFGGIVLALALAIGLRSKDLANWSVERRRDADRDPESKPFDHL